MGEVDSPLKNRSASLEELNEVNRLEATFALAISEFKEFIYLKRPALDMLKHPPLTASWLFRRGVFHARTNGFLVLALAGSLAGAAAATTAETKPKRPDPVSEIAAKLAPTRTVVYKRVGDHALRLHIFEPKGFRSTDRRTCFIAIHGGGWSGGEPRRFYPFAAHFADLGMVGISLEYRLINKKLGTTPFECAKDGRSAVRYVRQHAAELGIDPKRIVASGGSAGGHVAAATALFNGIDEAGEDTTVSCVPNALVLYFPVIDTSTEGYGNAKCGVRWQEISPVHHVKAGVPPTIVFHGTADTTTPFKGAQAFDQAMRQAGNRCELVVHEGGKHGYLMFDRKLYDESLQRTEQFLASLGFLSE